MLIPTKPVPALELPLVGGGTFDLASPGTERGTILTFYRGLHCPICATYLKDLERLTPEFQSRGFGTLAISCDTAEKAEAMAGKVGVDALRVAHSLPLAEARDWGLYISSARNDAEPAHFSEPGTFVVNADGTLYFASVQSMPFARMPFGDLVKGLDFVIPNDYPARGSYTGPL